MLHSGKYSLQTVLYGQWCPRPVCIPKSHLFPPPVYAIHRTPADAKSCEKCPDNLCLILPLNVVIIVVVFVISQQNVVHTQADGVVSKPLRLGPEENPYPPPEHLEELY